jgi:hypothetical protein
MTARRVLAVAVVVVTLAGCAPAESETRRGGRSGREQTWSTEVGWPFSLGVHGRDVVVTISRNQVVALDSVTGRERWRADVNQVTHYEPELDRRTVLVSADDRFVALERASGERRWEAPVGEHAAGGVLTRVGSEPIAFVTTERASSPPSTAARGRRSGPRNCRATSGLRPLPTRPRQWVPCSGPVPKTKP